MKHAVSLSLSLLLIGHLAGCAPVAPRTQVSAPPTSQGVLSVDEINSKGETFALLLMVKGDDGTVSPVNPERLESLSVGGKTVTPAEIMLPGSATAKTFSSEAEIQAEASKLLSAGKPWVIFGDNGVYTFVQPKSAGSTPIRFKLKDDSRSYEMLKVANMTRGTFLLDKGEIQGSFGLKEGFAIKATAVEYAVMLALIIAVTITAIPITPALSPEELKKQREAYYALANFDVASFNNYYQGNQGQAKITTQDNKQLVFETSRPEQTPAQTDVSSQDVMMLRTQMQTQVGASLSPLLSYVGSWTLESDLLKSLVPGGNMQLDLSRQGADNYRLSAKLASGTYSGEGRYLSGGKPDDLLKLSLSANGKSLDVEFRLAYANRLAAKLLKAEGIPELSTVVGTDVYFKRNITVYR